MLIIPYRMETTFTRIPYTNAGLIVTTSLLYFITVFLFTPEDVSIFVLRDWSAEGMIGNMFLHGGLLHLIGNMVFLWIFGNAVCAAVGNGAYIFLYLCLGVFASVVHLSMDARAAIGASGAINGIVGMTLVLFPKNRLHCWYWYAIPFLWIWKTGKIPLYTFWMILYWLAFDILGSLATDDGVAHWAHIGGLMGGVVVGLAAVKFNLIESYHHTLLDVFAGRSEEEDRLRALELESKVVVTEAAEFKEKEDRLQESQTVLISPHAVTSAPTEPDLQLKQCVGTGKMVTLYFINRGAPMYSLAVRAPQGVTIQLSQTAAITTGQTGWIRFSTADIDIDSIEFILNYLNRAKVPHKIRYRCIPASSTLTAVSSS